MKMRFTFKVEVISYVSSVCNLDLSQSGKRIRYDPVIYVTQPQRDTTVQALKPSDQFDDATSGRHGKRTAFVVLASVAGVVVVAVAFLLFLRPLRSYVRRWRASATNYEAIL